MRVKSYYGNSIREALDKARQELGADASILASRHADGTSGRYEVVCGVVDEPSAPQENPTVPVAREAASSAEQKPSGALSRLRAALARTTPPDDQLERVNSVLLAEGFGEDLTADIVAGVRQRQRQSGRNGAQPPTPAEALAAEIAKRLRVAPELGRTGAACRIVALVGPPGCGKTTTLVKLAVRYGLTGPGPLHIISTDSYRVGGTDALRAYAAGMGVEFHAAATPAALGQLIDAHRGKGLLLIDTPGLGPADLNGAASLALFLSRHMEAEVQLILPATMSAGALASVMTRFRPFLPSKLIVTCADQSAGFLPVIGQALLYDKPLSFIGTGQAVPEDIMEASLPRLCGTWSSELRAEAISAA